MEQNKELNTDKQCDIHGVIRRLDKQHEALEHLYENMSNPNIVEPLKELLNRDGYKAGFMDGFRTCIDYIKNGL